MCYNHERSCAKSLYKLVLSIAEATKPFTIAEELMMSCMKNVRYDLLAESSNKSNCIPSSNDTTTGRVDKITAPDTLWRFYWRTIRAST